MGLPCLRWDGQFFASYDRHGDTLIVKLAEARANELIAAGRADPCRPSGAPLQAVGRYQHCAPTTLA
jgi:hypothetical protein